MISFILQTLTPSYPVGSGGSFPGVKAVGGEDDLSLPSSPEVKNAWTYTSTHPKRLHDTVLNSAQDAPSRRGTYLRKETTLHHHHHVKNVLLKYRSYR